VDFPDSELLHFSFADNVKLILFFDHFAALSFLVGPISVTLFSVLFNQTTEHKHRCDIIFLHHSIEVVECWSKRPLSRDNFLSLKLDHIRIDVILYSIFLINRCQNWLSRIECHYMRVPVVWKLLRILVQFLQMILGLSHEC